MIRRAVFVIFCALYFLGLFAVESSPSPNYYGELEDLRMSNTTDLEEEEYFLEIDCNRFNLSLNFSDTFIRTIGKDFIKTPFLTCLNFERNNIESIASGAFDGLPALEYLNLARNSISSLFSFNGHNNLKALILANQSSYGEINLVVKGKYPELRYLDLSGNRLNTINEVIDNRLNETFAFPRLRYLDISRNRLRSFNCSKFKYNLTNLYFTSNNLDNIDLRTCTNLVDLRLDNNMLTGISDRCYTNYACIGEMPRLKYFSISNNRIQNIPYWLNINMPNLDTLDFSNNQLDDSISVLKFGFPSLKNVYLNNNRLVSISIFRLYRLLNLSFLSVAHNKFQVIVSNFIDAPALKKLILSNNEINVIEENAFSKLESLEELHLDNNNLNRLPIEWSTNLSNLRYLNLTNNHFTTLESLWLSQSLPLMKVDLIKNQLIHLKAEVLRNLPENVTIYLIAQSENNAFSKRSL